jgi:hypothetical protein
MSKSSEILKAIGYAFGASVVDGADRNHVTFAKPAVSGRSK